MVALREAQPPDDPNSETIEFIFELAKDLPERQAHDWEAIEAKAVQILTAASVVIGLASIGGRTDRLAIGPALLFGVGLAGYLFVLVMVSHVLRVRTIRLTRQLDWLWTNRHFELVDLKERLITDTMEAYQENADSLKAKARPIRHALLGLGVEAGCVTIALIWSRLIA